MIGAIGRMVDFADDTNGRTVVRIGNGHEVTIRTAELRHSDRAFGFRIEYNGRNLVYATDVENLPKPDKRILKLASGADLLIHDAQYTNEEYYGLTGDPKRNWGHSTAEAAAEVAAAANVKKLVLFHHDPYHDDAKVDQMWQVASAIFPNTVSAFEGMVIELQPAMVSAQSYSWEANTPREYSPTSEDS